MCEKRLGIISVHLKGTLLGLPNEDLTPYLNVFWIVEMAEMVKEKTHKCSALEKYAYSNLF